MKSGFPAGDGVERNEAKVFYTVLIPNRLVPLVLVRKAPSVMLIMPVRLYEHRFPSPTLKALKQSSGLFCVSLEISTGSAQ